MNINYKQQPQDSNQCGQACVAMILDITVEDACKLMKRRGKTQTADLATILKKNGFVVNKRRKLFKGFDRLPETCLLVAKHKKGSHWLLWSQGKVFDPAGLRETTIGDFCQKLLDKKMKVTSYLELSKA